MCLCKFARVLVHVRKYTSSVAISNVTVLPEVLMCKWEVSVCGDHEMSNEYNIRCVAVGTHHLSVTCPWFAIGSRLPAIRTFIQIHWVIEMQNGNEIISLLYFYLYEYCAIMTSHKYETFHFLSLWILRIKISNCKTRIILSFFLTFINTFVVARWSRTDILIKYLIIQRYNFNMHRTM